MPRKTDAAAASAAAAAAAEPPPQQRAFDAAARVMIAARFPGATEVPRPMRAANFSYTGISTIMFEHQLGRRLRGVRVGQYAVRGGPDGRGGQMVDVFWEARLGV